MVKFQKKPNIWRKYILPRLITPFIKGILKLLKKSCSLQIEGIENLYQTTTSAPTIIIFWHNQIAMIPEILKKIAPHHRFVALISNSRDGEWMARLTESYSQARTIRVPHDKRSQALQTAIKKLQQGEEVLIITPDGPRGPKYRVKPGVVLAAQAANALVIPMGWQASHFWQLKTWDGLMIPKPFSKICVKVGHSIYLKSEKKGQKEDLQEKALLLEQALSSLFT